jgi:hypothetical protein
MEALVSAIESKIFREWRHEGFIGGWSSDYIDVVIDDKEYAIKLREIKDGEHWSEEE